MRHEEQVRDLAHHIEVIILILPSYFVHRSYPGLLEPRSGGGGTSSGGGFSRSARPSWSSSNSAVTYTPAEVRSLTPVRRTVEERARAYPDLRDIFLCHAWDDRRGAAQELHDLLESNDVSVWFSEKDVVLGAPLLRAIDKGLAKSRAGIVLVTPALLTRLASEGSRIRSPRSCWRATSSFPLCTGRLTRLSGRSAPCSAREAA